MQEKVSAQYVNEIQMAKAQRDFELKKASYDYEINTKKAESEMAYQLQVPNDIQLGFQENENCHFTSINMLEISRKTAIKALFGETQM